MNNREILRGKKSDHEHSFINFKVKRYEFDEKIYGYEGVTVEINSHGYNFNYEDECHYCLENNVKTELAN